MPAQIDLTSHCSHTAGRERAPAARRCRCQRQARCRSSAQEDAQEEAMRKAMADPKMAKQVQEMQAAMERPEVRSQMQQMQAAMQNQELQQKVASLKQDPELKGIFESLQKGGIGAMMKAMNDPEILSKIGAKMGDINMEAVLADSAAQAAASPAAAAQQAPPGAAPAPEVNNLFDAAKAGDLEAVEDFLAVGRDVNERDANQCTPLHLAVAYSHAPVVAELLAARADPNLADLKGNTPLHYATGYGRVPLVRQLLEGGANGALENAGGQTPLDLAMQDERNPVQKDQQTLDLLEHAATVGYAD